jgi:hypothetical protein
MISATVPIVLPAPASAVHSSSNAEAATQPFNMQAHQHNR